MNTFKLTARTWHDAQANDDAGQLVLSAASPEMRDRIVACVNACDGIDTDLLKGFSPRFLATRGDAALAERTMLNDVILAKDAELIEAVKRNIQLRLDLADAYNELRKQAPVITAVFDRDVWARLRAAESGVAA